MIEKEDKIHQQIKHIRQQLHQHPETAYEEFQTSHLVINHLKGLGLEVQSQIGQTGVVGILQGARPKHAKTINIGLRADMDALNLQELNTFNHCSKIKGKMHACGHDGHTAMLLGAATALAQKPDFSGKVYFIFQPAEEGQAGAQAMIDDELFVHFPIDEVYGLHNWPGLAAGKIAIHKTAVMASADMLSITIEGHGGHAGMPHQADDPIIVCGQLINQIQSIVARNLSPHDSGVISITQIQAGHADNVIPNCVNLGGTIRSFSQANHHLLKQRLTQLCQGLEISFNVKIHLTFKGTYPATINHSTQANYARQAATQTVGKSQVVWNPPPSMGAEDFSFMLEKKPGAYIWLGNGGTEGSCELHNPHYDFNDDCAYIGANYWINLVYQRLI